MKNKTHKAEHFTANKVGSLVCGNFEHIFLYLFFHLQLEKKIIISLYNMNFKEIIKLFERIK